MTVDHLAWAREHQARAQKLADDAAKIVEALSADQDSEFPLDPIQPTKWDAHPMPFDAGWQMIARDDTGWVREPAPTRLRVRDDNEDWPPYLLHVVEKGSLVWPPRPTPDSPIFPVDLTGAKFVMLSYLHWRNQYHGWAGKDVALSIGHGHYGTGHTVGNPAITGDSGCTCNVMRPERGNKNGIRLFAADESRHMDDEYGYVIGEGDLVLPLRAWHRIQVVGHLDSGWQLFVNGSLECESMNGGAICDKAVAKAVSCRTRPMNGGVTRDMPARSNVSERYANYAIHIA